MFEEAMRVILDDELINDEQVEQSIYIAIYAAAFVRFLEEDSMQAGYAQRTDAVERAMNNAKIALELFLTAREQQRKSSR